MGAGILGPAPTPGNATQPGNTPANALRRPYQNPVLADEKIFVRLACHLRGGVILTLPGNMFPARRNAVRPQIARGRTGTEDMPSDAPACAGVLQTGARRWFCFVPATCVLVGWPAGVLGQGGELTREKLLAWFEAERAKAIDPPPLGNVRLDYEVREHATINAATMAQWKIDVEPYPEHPLRRRIVTEERRIKQGPDVTLGSIWRLRSDAWRHNKHPSVPTPGLALYGDYGQQGGQHWRLFEDSIVLDTPGSPVVQSSGPRWST